MHAMLNGPLAAAVRLRVVVPVVQERNARQVVAALATEVAQAVRAAQEAVSAHHQARRVVVRLREGLVRVHAPVVAAHEGAKLPAVARSPRHAERTRAYI